VPRPTARVLAILELLQSGGTHRVAELAERLGVDERTIRRYIGHLLALDIPVETVRGRYGGYRLASGFRMPPLMLSEDEALAIVLGLVRARADGRGGAADSATAVESALAKVRRAIPGALSARIEALIESTSFTTSAAGERASAEAPDSATLLSFAEAARGRHPVAFRYEDRNGRRSQRTMLPFGIVAHSGRWYVTGTDSLSGEVRTFRLDRITFPTVLPQTFDVPAVDAVEAVQRALAAAPWTHQVSVVVQGAADVVAPRIPSGIATLEPISATSVRVRFRAERLEWVPGMLARLELPFVVEGPPALREVVASVAARFMAAAAAVTDDVD
jgi:predicted DNA-binding transcriptional regulator YafY